MEYYGFSRDFRRAELTTFFGRENLRSSIAPTINADAAPITGGQTGFVRPVFESSLMAGVDVRVGVGVDVSVGVGVGESA